ncbi:TPA: hypothetical protein DF272_02130 [Candidatus Falkowbacteria bacterium]|nr:hypothetical protein [Candidatus Falkowbacteria bacterium]
MRNFILAIFTAVIFLLPQAVEAGATKIGLPCADLTGAECESNKCQLSDLTAKDNQFCVCQTAANCATDYGGAEADWECKTGDTSSHSLNYCFKTTETKNLYPLDSSQTPAATDTPAETDEGEKVIFNPPNLPVIGSYCNLQPVESSLGATAAFNWIGQCVVGLYKYGFMLGAMFAILMIIVGGILILSAGANPGLVSSGKKFIFSSLFGLIILLSSYIILVNINPDLVNIQSINLELIDAVELELQAGEEFHTEENSAPIPSDAVPESSLTAHNTTCQKSPPVGDGSGNKNLINILGCDTFYERDRSEVSYVILHDTGRGAAATANGWHGNCLRGGVTPGACISSHYVIETSGAIYQLVDESKIAHHANTKWNKVSIGIDLQRSLSTSWIYSRIDECVKACKEGFYYFKNKKTGEVIKAKFPGCDSPEAARRKCNLALAPAQYISLNNLLLQISTRTNVTIDNAHIRAHCESSSGHTDPRNFDWSKLGLSNAPHYTSGGKADALCKFNDKWEEKVEENVKKYFGTS